MILIDQSPHIIKKKKKRILVQKREERMNPYFNDMQIGDRNVFTDPVQSMENQDSVNNWMVRRNITRGQESKRSPMRGL